MRLGSDYGGLHGLRWRELLIIGMSRGSVIMEVSTVWLRWREMLIIGMRRGLWLWRYDWDEESCWSLGCVGVWLWRCVWIEMKRDADHWDEEEYDYGCMHGLRWRELMIIGMRKGSDYGGLYSMIEMKRAADHWDEARVWLWWYVWIEMKLDADYRAMQR